MFINNLFKDVYGFGSSVLISSVLQKHYKIHDASFKLVSQVAISPTTTLYACAYSAGAQTWGL
jgi:hypothetical protein